MGIARSGLSALRRAFHRTAAASAESPIIICGVPRSGTTMHGAFANSHGQVAVADEYPLGALGATRNLLMQYDKLMTREFAGWRDVDRQELNRRKAAMIESLWLAVSNPGLLARLEGIESPRMGMKTPRAELDYEFYEQVFAHRPPLWVYCLRHPAKVLNSLKAMPWARAEDMVVYVQSLYEQSYGALQRMQDAFAERVRVVQIDRVPETLEGRQAYAAGFFEFLGLKPDAGVDAFVRAWPVVDTWPVLSKDTHTGQDTPPGVPDSREVERLLDHAMLQEVVRRYGYA